MVLYNQNKRKFWCSEKNCRWSFFFVVQLYKELPPAAPYGKNNIEGDEANERIDS
jgi:hypothetical protein